MSNLHFDQSLKLNFPRGGAKILRGSAKQSQGRCAPSGGNFAKFWGGRAKDTSFLGGSGGMPPQKIFKIWTPEMAFAAF
jgi:hypothetical protein